MSDNHRTVLGLLACFLAIFLYMKFVMPRMQPKPEPGPSAPQQPARTPPPPSPSIGPATPTTSPASPTSRPAKAAPKVAALPAQEVKNDIICKTALFRVALTNRGGAIKSVTLSDFYLFPQDDPKPGQGDLKLVTEIEPGKLSLAMFGENDVGKLDSVVWEHVAGYTVPKGLLRKGFSKTAAQFRTVVAERGLEITKTFLFREPEKADDGKLRLRGRDIRLQIDVRNLLAEETSFAYRLRTAAGITPEPLFRTPEASSAAPLETRSSRDVAAVVCEQELNKSSLETFSAGKAPLRHDSPSAQLLYAGVKNRYFVAVVEPVASDRGLRAVHIEKIGENNVAATLELTAQQIAAGATASRQFLFLVTPRVAERLREYDQTHQFEALLDPGLLGPIKKVLTWLLNGFYSVIPNYGIAIVLLTLCVRALLHPLTLKSQKMAHKMQEIQPLIKAAKEKYKHDKQLQQQETMKIMREGGANPLGGCLPMLLQLPIFIGLWRSLYENASLRHAPFMLWINDLSKADSLVMFGSKVPILGQSFNLLPLLCAAVMVVQQKLTPKSADPQAQQTQKMMVFMPVLFAVMLYGMPAGLMIYFFCSSLFGLLEQQFIRRRLQAAAAAVPAASTSIPVEPKRQKPAPQKRKKRRRR